MRVNWYCLSAVSNFCCIFWTNFILHVFQRQTGKMYDTFWLTWYFTRYQSYSSLGFESTRYIFLRFGRRPPLRYSMCHGSSISWSYRNRKPLKVDSAKWRNHEQILTWVRCRTSLSHSICACKVDGTKIAEKLSLAVQCQAQLAFCRNCPNLLSASISYRWLYL